MYMLLSKSPVWQSTSCLTDETDVVVCEDNKAFKSTTEPAETGMILSRIQINPDMALKQMSNYVVSA